MFITDAIDRAGLKVAIPAMEKQASVGTNEALELADLMDKIASIHTGGENQDSLTQAILSNILDEGQSGQKVALIQNIRSQLTDAGVLT